MNYFGPPTAGFRTPQPAGSRFGLAPLIRPDIGFRGSPRGGYRGGPRPRGRVIPGRGEIIRMSPSKPTQLIKMEDSKPAKQQVKSEPKEPPTESTTSSNVEDVKPKEERPKEEHVEDIKPDISIVKDEPKKIKLDTYNSELHVQFEEDDMTASIMRGPGFEFMWGGARATHGVTKGKVCFEVHLLENQEVRTDEKVPHVTRIGWSVDGSDYQLGEDKLSWGYGGTGKSAYESKFRDYGKTYGAGDVVTCYIDLDATPKAIFYMVNGEYLGVAFRFTNELGGKAVFPHITCKNTKFRVNFGDQPTKFPVTNGFSMIHSVPAKQLVSPPQGPTRPEEAEVIMMVGLPACGKSFWCEKYAEQHPDKKYYILGTNVIIDRMKVTGLTRKRNYHGRWEELIKRASGVLNKLFVVAKKRPKNYILDQTNVYSSARRRKMESFRGYKRIAAVLINKPHILEQRKEKQKQVEGKHVPEEAIREMKRNFTLPEIGPSFDDVWYLEELQETALGFVKSYQQEGGEFRKPLRGTAEPVEKKQRHEIPGSHDRDPQSSYIDPRQSLMAVDTSTAKPPVKAADRQDSRHTPTRPIKNDSRHTPGNEPKQDSRHPPERGDFRNRRQDDRDRSRDGRGVERDNRDRREYRPDRKDDRGRDFYRRDNRGHDDLHRDDRNRDTFHPDSRKSQEDTHPSPSRGPFRDNFRGPHREDQRTPYRNNNERYPPRERTQSPPRDRTREDARGPSRDRSSDTSRDYNQGQFPREGARNVVSYDETGRDRMVNTGRYIPGEDRSVEVIRNYPEEAKPPISRDRGVTERRDFLPDAQEKRFSREQELSMQPEYRYQPAERALLPHEQDRLSRRPPQDRGIPPQDRGIPPQDRGIPPQERGIPPQERGIPPQERGIPPQERGIPLQDRGIPPQDRGIPPQDRGIPPRDRVIPPRDRVIPPQAVRDLPPLQDRILPQSHERSLPPPSLDRPPIQEIPPPSVRPSLQDRHLTQGNRVPYGRPIEYGRDQEPIQGQIERQAPPIYKDEREPATYDRNQSYSRFPVAAQVDPNLPTKSYEPSDARVPQRDYPISRDNGYVLPSREQQNYSREQPEKWNRSQSDYDVPNPRLADQHAYDRPMYGREDIPRDLKTQQRWDSPNEQQVVSLPPPDRGFESRKDHAPGSQGSDYFDRMNQGRAPAVEQSKNHHLPNQNPDPSYYQQSQERVSDGQPYGRDDYRSQHVDPPVYDNAIPDVKNQGSYPDRSASNSYENKPFDQPTRNYPPHERDNYRERHNYGERQERPERPAYGASAQPDANRYKTDYSRQTMDDYNYRKEQPVGRESGQRLDPYHDERRQDHEQYRHDEPGYRQANQQNYDAENPMKQSAALQPNSATDSYPYVYTSNSNHPYHRSSNQVSSSYQTQMTTSTANYSRPLYPPQYSSETTDSYQSKQAIPSEYQNQSKYPSNQQSDNTQSQAPPPPPDASANTATSYEQQQEDYQKAYSQWYENYAQAFAQIAQSQQPPQ